MAQLAPQPEVVLDFENQTLIELLSEDGLVIMARWHQLNKAINGCSYTIH